MPDPGVTDPTEFQYYTARHGLRFDSYSKPRTQQQLQSDVNKAHDNLRKLIREKDTLQHRLRNANLKIWILVGAVTGEFAILGMLAKLLFSVVTRTR